MSHLIFLTALLASFAYSSSPDGIVREANTLQTSSASGSRSIRYAKHAAAERAVLTMLQQGKGNNTCRKLAQETIDEIEASVDTSQATLYGINNGTTCAEVGQSEVQARRVAKKLAHSKLTKATGVVDAAYHSKIRFGALKYRDLKGAHCSWQGDHASYIAAGHHWKGASATKYIAAEEAEAADEALDAAGAVAVELTNQCLCDVKQEQADTWDDANADNVANQEAWDNAYRMLCVLEDLDADACVISSVPKVSKVYVHQSVALAKCSSAPSYSPTHTPTVKPSSSPTWNPTAQPTQKPKGKLQPTSAPTSAPTGQCEMSEDEADNCMEDYFEIANASCSDREPTMADTCSAIRAVNLSCPVTCSAECYAVCQPTAEPTVTPTPEPTVTPTPGPTVTPTTEPTAKTKGKLEPTSAPSTVAPTTAPTNSPTGTCQMTAQEEEDCSETYSTIGSAACSDRDSVIDSTCGALRVNGTVCRVACSSECYYACEPTTAPTSEPTTAPTSEPTTAAPTATPTTDAPTGICQMTAQEEEDCSETYSTIGSASCSDRESVMNSTCDELRSNGTVCRVACTQSCYDACAPTTEPTAVPTTDAPTTMVPTATPTGTCEMSEEEEENCSDYYDEISSTECSERESKMNSTCDELRSNGTVCRVACSSECYDVTCADFGSGEFDSGSSSGFDEDGYESGSGFDEDSSDEESSDEVELFEEMGGLLQGVNAVVQESDSIFEEHN